MDAVVRGAIPPEASEWTGLGGGGVSVRKFANCIPRLSNPAVGYKCEVGEEHPN